MKKIILVSIVLMISCFSISCGYTTRANLPSNLRYIYIENFKNNIDFSSGRKKNLYLPRLEIDARNAIIDRFMVDGGLRIAPKDEADLVLKGELKSYQRDGLRYSDNDEVEERRVRVTVALEMYDTKNQEVKWSEPNFSGEATYFVSGANATSEASAITEALKDLARRIVERTVEDW